jgi:hypothetical protein
MKKYRPSNGTEGMAFCEHFCERCIHENPSQESKRKCDILTATMLYDVNEEKYPKEWTYDENGSPTCTNWVKWDWNNDGDPDDPDNPKAPIPENPNQLCFPFLLDEIGIPKQTPQTV